MKTERIRGFFKGVKDSFLVGSINPLRFQLAASQDISNYPNFYLICKIKHEAHLLDKAVKNPYYPGRATARKEYLAALLNELDKRNLDFIEVSNWAYEILGKYDIWTKEKTSQMLLGDDVFKALPELAVPSIRFWKEGTPPESQIIECINSGQMASASCNRQAFLIKVVVNDTQNFDGEGARNTSMFATAPYRVFIYYSVSNYSEKYAAMIDIGMFAQNFVLKAKNLGLGTCCCYASEHLDHGQAYWKKKFDLSNEFYCGLTILVGIPKEVVSKPPRIETKKIVEFVKA